MVKFKSLFSVICVLFVFLFFVQKVQGGKAASEFVHVKGTQFLIGEKPYYYIGANFWAVMNLGSTQEGRERLIRELDRLKAIGVNNLRIFGATEGPSSEPQRIIPAVQESPG